MIDTPAPNNPPFYPNQRVVSKYSDMRLIKAGDHLRVLAVTPGKSESGWMVEVTRYRPGRIPARAATYGTFDSGWFAPYGPTAKSKVS